MKTISFVPFAVYTFVLLISTQAVGAQLISGAGASFPYPLYSKWFSEYRHVDKSVKINYQSIGSGGGIRQFLKGTTDFGASDAPMKDKELAKSKQPILHIPTTMGAVAVTYNIPGVKTSLKLTPDVLAQIFMGKIKTWNDPAIANLNPQVKLPEKQYIVVARRSDGSGTTYIFTDYLSKISSAWKEKIGTGKSVKWPTGLGAKGNEGVTGLVKNNPGAIGYVELTYALSNQLPVVALKNKAGKFVVPSVSSVSAAADGQLKELPSDFRASITNASGQNAYPVAAFTYLLVHQHMPKEKGQKLVQFLKWAMADGQKMAPALMYAPLPKSLISKVMKKVEGISFK